MKLRCEKCKFNFNMLTEGMLCASCHKDKFGNWAKEFSQGKDAKGNTIPIGGNHMKFSKGKEKRLDTGKKMSIFREGK